MQANEITWNKITWKKKVSSKVKTQLDENKRFDKLSFEWNPISELIRKLDQLILKKKERGNCTWFWFYCLNENIGFIVWLQQWKGTHHCII